MFRRKPKTRVERARDDLDKFRKQAREKQVDLSKQLNRTANQLRGDVQHLLEDEDRARVQRVAQELEHVADNVEQRAEKRLGAVSKTASQNVWTSLLIAFAIGLLIGLFLKYMRR